MHHIRHTAFTAHGFEHIPESHPTVGRQILLVTDKVFNAGHGPQAALFGFILAVAHTDNENSGLGKACFKWAMVVSIPSR